MRNACFHWVFPKSWRVKLAITHSFSKRGPALWQEMAPACGPFAPWGHPGGPRLGPLARPLPGRAALLAACGLAARPPGPPVAARPGAGERGAAEEWHVHHTSWEGIFCGEVIPLRGQRRTNDLVLNSAPEPSGRPGRRPARTWIRVQVRLGPASNQNRPPKGQRPRLV